MESVGSPDQSLHRLTLKLPVLSTHSLGLSFPALYCLGLVPTPQNVREPRRTTYTDEFIGVGMGLSLGEPVGSLAAMSLPTDSVQWPSAPLYSIMCLSFKIEWLS